MSMQTESADDVLKRWQAEGAAVQARWQAAGAKPGVATPEQLRGKSGLQVFEAMFAGELPRTIIGHTMNFEAVKIELGEVIFQGAPSADYLNPMGTLHGGWYCTLLDSALGCAVHTTLPAGKAYTTLELKVNIIRSLSPKVPLVRAIGKVIHVGGQVATAEAQLLGHDGKLYAHGTTTCLIFDARF
jgi:uncharacterized protein (TIGR00369 family)